MDKRDAINRALAEAQAGPENAPIECPGCGRRRPKPLVIKGRCDQCTIEHFRSLRAEIAPPSDRQWPEVRQRRDLMLSGTDHLVLADRPEKVQQSARPYRQKLRDITDMESPDQAWAELDRLEANPPK